MGRGLAQNRENSDNVIKRKLHIQKEAFNSTGFGDNHKLSKGKIHCSCWMCSTKTKIRGDKISDQRKKCDEE